MKHKNGSDGTRHIHGVFAAGLLTSSVSLLPDCWRHQYTCCQTVDVISRACPPSLNRRTLLRLRDSRRCQALYPRAIDVRVLSSLFMHISHSQQYVSSASSDTAFFLLFPTRSFASRLSKDISLHSLRKTSVPTFYVSVSAINHLGWDVKWCPMSKITIPCHSKDRFTGFRRRVGSRGPPGKLQNSSKTDHF